jgi:hypothetical protein
VALAWEVEQHLLAVIKNLFVIIATAISFIRPGSWGEATDAVPIFNFEQGDRVTSVVTIAVEIGTLPPVIRTSIEKVSHQELVSQKIEQEFFLLSIWDAPWIH